MVDFIQKCAFHILTVFLAKVIFVVGQDSFGFKCTYQIIGPDNMVLSAFDDGYRGSWLGKVTAEPYQQDIRQHWETINYLGTNLTTLTPEDNPDNHIALNMRRWCPVWKTEFPLQNTYKIIEENDKMFVLKKMLFQLNQTAAEEDEINFGCVQYMGSLILCLMVENEAQIQTSKGMSKPILVQKGVFQGSPLSPQLFNISIDHVLRELNEREVSDAYGFHLHKDVPNVAGRGFADDIALVSSSIQGARELTKIAISNFNKVGYDININKCKVINIVKGKLCEDPLVVDDNNIIESIKKEETVRYLGVNFNNEISFDPASSIKNFTKDLQNLVGTPMLFPNQKIAIINQYLWPCLTYSLQTAPLNKLPKTFLEDLDKLIRSAVKDILAIPHDSPNALLYTSKKCRGLQIMRSTWEAFIQHYNICVVLLSCNDPYIPFVKDLKSEMESCIVALQLDVDEVQSMLNSRPKTKPGKILRETLRNQEYDQWCSFPLRGQGVELYKECPYGNKIIIEKRGLTSSEWLNTLKMSANVYPVKAIPGRSLESSLCRHCKEKETLAHVLGKCHVGSLLRNTRHHDVRTIIANHLKTLDWIVHEEVTDGASKRVDIICWRKDLLSGYILDPTIRMEQSCSQAEEVNIEKQAHYNPCIPYFLDKYKLKKLEVVGLLVGARGTITEFFESFRKELRLPSKMIEEIVVATIRGSCRIAHNHLYNMNLSHS